MHNDEIVEHLKAIVADLDLIAEELHWREAGYPNLEDFDWSVRVRNAFGHVGINSLRKLVELTPRDVVRIPNLGQLSLQEIENNLATVGLRLADKPKAPYPFFFKV